MNRREYVSVVGTTGLVGVAGCVGELGQQPVLEEDPTTEAPPSNEDLGVSDEKAIQVGETIQPAVVQLLDENDKGVGGTGWFLDESTVITNAHLARRGGSYKVETFAENSYDAELLGRVQNMQPDIAALEITPPDDPAYSTLSPGTTSALERADPLVQVGHPGSIGLWVISLGAYLSRHESGSWLTSTVPVLRGNSGSPVVTLEGDVVGLTTGETWDEGAVKDFRDLEAEVYRHYPTTTQTTHVPIELVEETVSEWR